MYMRSSGHFRPQDMNTLKKIERFYCKLNI